ncbi:unnamed protein product [Rhizophagus irregularis]|nr:unnamed protein product [Rhizophagus irregularis]
MSIFHSNFLRDISSLLNDADDFNVIINVGKYENIKEFRAHSVILRARCPYFKAALSNGWITKQNDMIMFTKPNITPTVFEMVLKYIYTGELDLTNQLGKFSSSEYFDKIRPYKAIIPINIYDEIEEYYFKNVQPKTMNLTPRKKIIESNLIKPKLANIITNWIERKGEKDLLHKYKFELIYRSSQDGLNINTFRTKCNEQGQCLVLVKHSNSTKIYGGYNPLYFTNTIMQYYNTTESFIFSFENSKDIQNMKISRVNNNYTLHENYNDGFNFLNTLYMNGQQIYFDNHGYYDENISNVLNPYLGTNFIPEEIEVFKIITI